MTSANFQESSISSLGGMARIREIKSYFSCPPWINEDIWNEYRASYEKASMGEPDFLQLDLELADNCNYRCIECPISDDLAGRVINTLSFEKASKVLDSAARQGVKALKLNYINEPLLAPDKLIEVASYANRIGFLDIYMTTNGSLLTEKVSAQLINSNLFSRIQVSLDAFSDQTYSKIRVGGSLSRVKKNIFTFLKLRSEQNSNFPKIRVSFLTLPENKHEAQEFYDFWADKVDAIALQSSVLKPRTGRKNISEYENQRSAFCPNPFRQLVVRANGDVLPCCSFWGENLKLGNLNESPELSNYFSSLRMKQLQQSFNDSDLDLSEACKSCLSSCDPS